MSNIDQNEEVTSDGLEQIEGLDAEQIVATIIELGNQILGNMGVEEQIEDVSVFFTDTFYIQFFQQAFPDFDFSPLENSEDDEQMANNIQSLIDLLSSKILMYDLGHIQGEQIVNGNPEHCINLLQLVKEISGMMNTNSNAGQMFEEDDDENQESEQNKRGGSNEDSGEEIDEQQLLADQFHPDGIQDQINLEGDGIDDEAQEMHGRQAHMIDNLEYDAEDDDDEDQEVSDMGDFQQQRGSQDEYADDIMGNDNENEVSINLQDAIATAEQLNQDGSMDDMHQQIVDGLEDIDNDIEDYDEMADQIAGIVTDGGHQRDGFDQLREDHQQQQLMQQDGQDDEDQDDGQDGDYGIEDNDGIEGEDDNYSDQDDEEDVGELQKNIDPNLLAVAHDMGIDMNSEQIQELQKFIQEQYNGDGGQDDEDEDGQDGDEDADEEQLQSHQQQQSNRLSQQQHSTQKKSSHRQQQQMQGQDVEDQSEEEDDEDLRQQQMLLQAQQYSNDEQAYAYLAQQEQLDGQRNMEDDDDEIDDDDVDDSEQILVNQSNNELVDEDEDDNRRRFDQDEDDEEEDEGDKGEGEGEEEPFFDVNNLNDEQREAIAQYLKQEYEKDPEGLQDQRENLQKFIEEQLLKANSNSEDPEGESDQGEDIDQEQGHDQDYGDQQDDDGEQQIDEAQMQAMLVQDGERDGDEDEDVHDGDIQEDDEDQMDDQDDDQELDIQGGGQQIEEDGFPSEQDLEDQELTQEQIQQILAMKQQQEVQQQQMYGVEEVDDEQVDQHQMHQMYMHQKKQKKRKQIAPQVTHGMSNRQSRIPHRAMVGQIGATDNLNPNALKRLMQAPQSKPSRPQTAKRAQAKPHSSLQRPQTAKTRQPTQSIRSYKQFIASQQKSGRPATAGSQSKPVRRQSAKRKVKRHQLNTISHPVDMQAQPMGPGVQGIDEHQFMQQLAQQQEMPMFNEEFLSQLSQEQLAQVIQHQQALIQQHPQAVMPTKKSASVAHLPPKASGPRRSRSAKRSQQNLISASNNAIHGFTENSSRQAARTRANIYSQSIQSLGGSQSGRRKTSKTSSRNSRGDNKGKTSTSTRSKGAGRRKKVQPGQGILLNNFFPALESGSGPGSGDKITDQQVQAMYAPHQQNQQVINEVSPEDEEGDSQELVNSRIQSSSQMQQSNQDQMVADQLLAAFEEADPEHQRLMLEQMSPEQQMQLLEMQKQHQEQMYGQVQNQEDMEGQDGEGHLMQSDDQQVQDGDVNNDVELTDTQLVQLLQNSDKLSIEQQAQLQHILKTRYKQEIKSQKEMQYHNIYNILTENVAKAKVRLSKLADSPSRANPKQLNEDKETMERIVRQKREYETLLRQHAQEVKVRNKNKQDEQRRLERQIAREVKLKEIREKKFEEELINQQKSLMYKRNAQQVRLCTKVYKLASDLEKSKLLLEKKQFIENQNQKKTQKRIMVDGIEQFYRDKINMLRERIETEKFERKIAQNAQKDALTRMKKELDLSKKKEIEKYLVLLKQEDQKYDFQSSNLNKIEDEIIKIYKK